MNCAHIIHVTLNGKKTFCPRQAIYEFEKVGAMCDLHWPLALIAGFKVIRTREAIQVATSQPTEKGKV